MFLMTSLVSLALALALRSQAIIDPILSNKILLYFKQEMFLGQLCKVSSIVDLSKLGVDDKLFRHSFLVNFVLFRQISKHLDNWMPN